MSDQGPLVDVIRSFAESDADHLWLIADDVYFDLDERRFFGELESCGADLLSTMIATRSEAGSPDRSVGDAPGGQGSRHGEGLAMLLPSRSS